MLVSKSFYIFLWYNEIKSLINFYLYYNNLEKVMRKQKTRLLIISLLSLFSLALFAGKSEAYGGAVVSWVAPTTDQGGGALTGLTGYRVYYSTSAISCTNWNAADQATRLADAGTLLPSTYRTVASGSTITYVFSNTTYLTPGSTYNFAVVAYDSSTNLSNCAQTSGGASYVSKLVSYSADINNDHYVDYLDYGLFHPNYNTTNAGADFDKSGLVNYLDYGILHTDYGLHF